MSYTIRLYRKGLFSHNPVYYDYEEDISYNHKPELEYILGENHLFKWKNQPVYDFLKYINNNFCSKDAETVLKISETYIEYRLLENLVKHIYKYAIDDGFENIYLEIV